MLKTELHAHTSDDPEDLIRHTPGQLIDRAAALDYGALAITLHNGYTGDAALTACARAVGITLLPGIEPTIEGRDVLLVNVPAAAARVSSFDDLRALKRAFPMGSWSRPTHGSRWATASDPRSWTAMPTSGTPSR